MSKIVANGTVLKGNTKKTGQTSGCICSGLPWDRVNGYHIQHQYKIEAPIKTVDSYQLDLYLFLLKAFSFPEAVLLLVSTKNRDLCSGPTPEVRDSRTFRRSAHAQVKSDKSDGWCQSIVFTKPLARGRDSCR